MPPDASSKASRRLLHKGRRFDFEILEYTGRSGRVVTREVVRHPGSVVILPILDDGRVVLIQNYRASLDQSIYELPAGTLEPPEPPADCARRELIEETGFEAATVSVLGRFYTSPGLSDERMSAFLAAGLTHVGQRLEDGEEATIWPVTTDQAMQMIDSGELSDAKSMLLLLMARQRGLI